MVVDDVASRDVSTLDHREPKLTLWKVSERHGPEETLVN